MSYDEGFDRDGHAVWSTGPNGETDYGYDNNNRLINVRDYILGKCTTRQYTFSKDGNRTALKTSNPAGDGSCQTATSTTVSSSYNSADRDTIDGYAYDKLGRVSSIPSRDVSGGAELATGYYNNDTVASMTQGAKTKSFALDPNRRARQVVDSKSGSETQRILNHYSDASDSPAWISTSTDGGSTSTWQRNIIGIDGQLGAVQASNGTVQIQLSNMHGDIVATVDDDQNAVSTNSYFEQAEYGAPRADNSSDPARYGWLGGQQRSNETVAGMILMGARLYNPATGTFTSIDPVSGGNENSYNYPNDPVNASDASGMATWGACGSGTSKYKTVRTFTNRVGSSNGRGIAAGRSLLDCGTPANWGYKHIKAGKQARWEYLAAIVDSDWRSMCDWAINQTFRYPSSVTYASRNDTFVYRTQIQIREYNGGKVVATYYAYTIVARVSKNIITAYYSSK